MPGRITPLVVGEIYHIFNRGIDRRQTFTNKWEYQRAINAIKFYRIANPPIRLSKFLTFEDIRKNQVLEVLQKSKPLVEILSFCLMPNHFHLLLRQKEIKGISIFLSNFQNSYTRYFNTRHQRDGSLFLDQFKAVRIENEEQLIHVSRYIHLNPYTGFIIKTVQELNNYTLSSLPLYLKDSSNDYIERDTVLSYFKNQKEYWKFITDQSDYQRRLKQIEHLTFE